MGCAIVGNGATVGGDFVGGIGEAVGVFVGSGVGVGVRVRVRVGVKVAVRVGVGVNVAVGGIATANLVGGGTWAGRTCVVDWQPVTHNTSKNNLVCKSRTEYIRLIFFASR